jgi:probable addiction module antidote protein
MEIKTPPYDVSETLRTPDEMAAYLEACIEEADGDAAFIAKALGDIARAQGMRQIARQAGAAGRNAAAGDLAADGQQQQSGSGDG